MSIRVATANELGISAGQVTAFYLAQWARRLAVSVPDFYAWQFTAGPDCKGEDNCIVAYDSASERIAGVLGVNQRHFMLAGREERAAELTSWVVAADYRSTGVGVPMIQLAMERYDVLLAMGVTEFSLPVFLRSGFRHLRAIPRFLRAFDFDGLKEVATIPPLAKKLAKQ